MHAQRNTTMRDCQPTPRGDGHGPWKLWLEPVYRADLMIYSTTSSASPNARDFAERSLWNIGLWRFHCALMPLVGLPRSASCAMIFGSVSAVLISLLSLWTTSSNAHWFTRRPRPAASLALGLRFPADHRGLSRRQLILPDPRNVLPSPPSGANRLFPINQLINRRWAR